jgi:hypothetical protein
MAVHDHGLHVVALHIRNDAAPFLPFVQRSSDLFLFGTRQRIEDVAVRFLSFQIRHGRPGRNAV